VEELDRSTGTSEVARADSYDFGKLLFAPPPPADMMPEDGSATALYRDIGKVIFRL
jgi:hypothetical protein